MKFNINYYNGKYTMHCSTHQEAIAFLEYLDSIGKRWCSGESYVGHDNYHGYGSETCYYFNDGSYGSRSFARKENYQVLEFSDFDWDGGEPEITMSFDELFQAR